MRKMPAQRPGKSEQTVCTPPEFIDAIEDMFGEIDFDLAATAANRVREVPFFGPDHPAEHCRDALASKWPKAGLAFLNPPYANIAKWAAKIFEEQDADTRLHILLLVPASVGSNWWRDFVAPWADVYILGGRLTFQGHKSSFPKDLALCHFWSLGGRKFHHWNWRGK